MTYEQIISNLKSLGFADNSDYEEYETNGYTYDAINRAISEITTHFPYIAKKKLELIPNACAYIDMDETFSDFLGFASNPLRREISIGSEYLEKSSDYELDIEDNSMQINTDNDVRAYYICYKAKPTTITSDTPMDFVTEVPLKAHHLIPLLASFYLWQDDEPTKAAQYYNVYESSLNTLMANEEKPRIRVVDGYSRWGRI